jgi:antirestriction protein ArdC
MIDSIVTSNPQSYSTTNSAQGINQYKFQASEALPSLPKYKLKTRFHQKSSPDGDDRQDIYTRVTNKIIADLENGNLTWVKPWKTSNGFGDCLSLPLRCDGQPYQGINVLSLWGAAAEKGYTRPIWMTFKKAQELGGCVKKGEKGTLVVYANKIVKSETDDQGEETISAIPFLKGYTAFNVEQIGGLPEKYYKTPSHSENTKARIEFVEKFIAETKAVIQHGGNKALYNPSQDMIQMPLSQAFPDSESYYATLAHEIMHWTNHPSRLDRQFGEKRFGNSAYAMEELVAEIGSAFLCAALGITLETREDHAAYVQHWLSILKKDNRAIFTAASHAQRAVNYLHGLSAFLKPSEML